MTKAELAEIAAIARELKLIDDLPPSVQESANERKLSLQSRMILFEKKLMRLSSVERSIIQLRYIQGLSWKRTASAIHYSESQARKILSAAVKKIEKKQIFF